MAQVKLPPVGSFPGYRLGRSLFEVWASTLNQQADIWNANWAKLISGEYKIEDYYAALAQSLRSSSGAIEQAVKMTLRAASPPWFKLVFSETEATEVHVQQALQGSDQPRCSAFSLLGGSATQSTAPVATATRTGAYSLAITFDAGQKPSPGDYLGLVSSRGNTEPLAVLVVTVRPPKAPKKK